MTSFTLLIGIISAIVFIILVAYGLVIFGLRDAFMSGQDIGSRLATYVTLPEETTPQEGSQRRRRGLVRWRFSCGACPPD